MNKFKDATNKEWALVLNVGQFRKIREATGIDLGKLLADPDAFTGIYFSDPEKLSSILWACCVRDGTKEETFLESLDSQTLEEARAALMREIIDFFPQARTLKAKFPAMMDAMGREIDRQIEASITKASAGDSPG